MMIMNIKLNIPISNVHTICSCFENMLFFMCYRTKREVEICSICIIIPLIYICLRKKGNLSAYYSKLPFQGLYILYRKITFFYMQRLFQTHSQYLLSILQSQLLGVSLYSNGLSFASNSFDLLYKTTCFIEYQE